MSTPSSFLIQVGKGSVCGEVVGRAIGSGNVSGEVETEPAASCRGRVIAGVEGTCSSA